MFSDKWNADIKVTRMDRVFEKTFLRWVPKSVLPNHLTVLRIFLVIPTAYLLATERLTAGIALFLFASLTDALDGALARTRRQITEWGILYDPLADKLLIGAVLFLVVLQHINFTLGVALLCVEAFLVVTGWINKRRGVIEPANAWGKAKMGAEVLGILLLLIALASGVELFVDLSEGTLAIALVTAIVSIFAKML